MIICALLFAWFSGFFLGIAYAMNNYNKLKKIEKIYGNKDIPSQCIKEGGFSKGGRNEGPPTTPRPKSTPIGQG